MLAKRLVSFTSASDDAESNMISKLKDACGYEYTSKLLRMFQDMSLCKDLNDEFKEKMSATHDAAELGVDFHVLVLNTAAWPLSGPSTDLKLPVELLKTHERFEGFYGNKHT
jgi:cullin 1